MERMETKRHTHLVCRAILMALLGMAFVSCKSDKPKEASSPDIQPQETAGVSASEEAKYEDFREKFLGILAKSDVMQSALTKEVEEFCHSLTPTLLAQLLHFAAQGPPEAIDTSNWLLGYNQLMVTASNKLGEQAASQFYQLAANTKADPVLRDYASQHYFRTELKHLSTMNFASESKAVQERLSQIMEQAEALVSSTDPNAGTMPGASLLGLVAVAERYNNQPAHYQSIKDRIESLTMPILRNWATQSPATRSAALQAAARMHLEPSAEVAWSVATDPNAEVIDRLGAIGALKHFPARVDAKALIASSQSDERLKKAAERLLSTP